MLPQVDWKTGGLPAQTDNTHKQQGVKDSKYGFLSDVNKDFNPVPSKLSLEERFKLIRSIGSECIQEDELLERLKEPRFLRCYDGFEPSGRMHIAQGILRAINVNKLVDAGCVFIFWVADWFAMLNNKFKGDLEKIRLVGRYFIEVWKAVGMKMSNVEFLWASDKINEKAQDYWMLVMDIARKNTISRIKKCATIMGRNEGDDLATSQLLYPCMQCADIFFLNVDICQLGIDQRKVNMLAREYKNEGKKPIIVSHDMILGLLEDQPKMSKSNPDSAIFMEDSAEEVNRKIKKAFCREKEVAGNPIMDYVKSIIFQVRSEFKIERPAKWGGDLQQNVQCRIYASYADLQKDFIEGKVHPGDLKPAVAKVLNELIEPVRQHFKNNEEARNLLKLITEFTKKDAEEKEKEAAEKAALEGTQEGKAPEGEVEKPPAEPKKPKGAKKQEGAKKPEQQQQQKKKKGKKDGKGEEGAETAQNVGEAEKVPEKVPEVPKVAETEAPKAPEPIVEPKA